MLVKLNIKSQSEKCLHKYQTKYKKKHVLELENHCSRAGVARLLIKPMFLYQGAKNAKRVQKDVRIHKKTCTESKYQEVLEKNKKKIGNGSPKSTQH